MKRELHIFREVKEPLPAEWEHGHWQVESHCDFVCPVGIAWVNCVGLEAGTPPLLEFIHVLPTFQRQGVAKRLVRACLKRWPNLEMTDGISAAGRALLRSVKRKEKRR